jgi:hypothetical protein
MLIEKEHVLHRGAGAAGAGGGGGGGFETIGHMFGGARDALASGCGRRSADLGIPAERGSDDARHRQVL